MREAAELSERIPRPRKASNEEVAVLEASILRRFEDLEATARLRVAAPASA